MLKISKHQTDMSDIQTTLENEKYRAYGLRMTPAGGNRVHVYSKMTQKSGILASTDVELLSFCKKFDTIHNHALAYCQNQNQAMISNIASGRSGSFITRLLAPLAKIVAHDGIDLPIQEKNVAAVQQKLIGYIQAGLLVSETALYLKIMKVTQADNTPTFTTNTITSVGIPTRNRPEFLSRAINSFLTNTQRHGRDTKFTIVDGSREIATQTKNKEVLSKISSEFGVNIYYSGIEERQNYCKMLSNYAEVSPDIVEFALLGDDRCEFSYGANRNTLLLQSVGEVCLQTDDDTICNISPSPNIERGLALTSEKHSHEFWFYASRSEALESVHPIEKDLLSIHEKLLGKSVCEAVTLNVDDGINAGQPLVMDDINPAFVEDMQLPNAKVAITYIGSVGDSGLRKNSNASRLFLKNGDYERLVSSEQEYAMNLNTRNILRVAPYNTISKNDLFINMCTGLDNRNLLPPFMPVQRRDDGIFGRVLRVCFPQMYTGFLPYVIYHDPPEDRTEVKEDLFSSLKLYRTNDFLDMFISISQSTLPGTDSRSNMVRLGQFLSELSMKSTADFTEYTRIILYNAISGKIQMAERWLKEHGNAPEYWLRDMNRYLATLSETLTQEDIYVPADLHGNMDEKLELFQELVERFGKLLIYWPDIVDAAKVLKSKQHTPASIL